jgi:uncharacterized membrane protein
MLVSERIDGLEQRVALLERRLHELDPTPGHRPRPATRPSEPARAAQPTTSPAPPPSTTPARPARPAQPTPPTTPPTQPPFKRPAQAATSRPHHTLDPARLEELLGGRVLAWVGAIAVLTGIFFLLLIAVSRGWIGEAERTLAAGLASLALLLVGVRLHERRGRTEAALAAAAAGIAGLFASLSVAGALYDLVPGVAALAGALVTGAAATGLALRWRAPGIGALGIVGALLAPALVGAQPSAEGVALLAVATGSATAVLVWQRWNWLAFAAFAIATPQWLLWLGVETPSTAASIATLVTFGALTAAAAVGFELRSRAPKLRVSSAVLLVLNALVLATAGWSILSETASDLAGHVWLAGLAGAHLVVGLASGRLRRVSHELGLIALALGIVLADVAFASVVDGLPVLLGFTASGIGFAALLRRGARANGDLPFAAAGLGGHLLLALGHALVLDAPPDAVHGGFAGATALIALAAVAAGCAVSSNLVAERHPHVSPWLDGAGLAVFAYLTVVALGGPALTIALAVEAAVLARYARRTEEPAAALGAAAYLAGALLHLVGVSLVPGVTEPEPLALLAGVALAAAFAVSARAAQEARAEARPLLDGLAVAVAVHVTAAALDGATLTCALAAEAVVLGALARRFRDPLAAIAGLAVLAIAAVHALVTLAPPAALVEGVADPLAAALGLGAVALAAAALAPLTLRHRAALTVVAGIAALYLASVEVVTPFQPGDDGLLSTVELSAREQGQALLSALWAVAGFILLVAGLLKDRPALRRGALALLAVTVAKVFVYDLASLTEIYRVASFIVLGLLLLGGAFAWQRVRPRPLPDLRAMPDGLR